METARLFWFASTEAQGQVILGNGIREAAASLFLLLSVFLSAGSPDSFRP
jgi:hypothetical protein